MSRWKNICKIILISLLIIFFLGETYLPLMARCGGRQQWPPPPPPPPPPIPPIPPIIPIIPSLLGQKPKAMRPAPGTGIAPYFWDNLFDNPVLTASVLPMWENWWIRNRMHYLSFKEPIVWFEVGINGETMPVASELRNHAFSVLTDCMQKEKNPLVRVTAALALGKIKDKSVSGTLKDSFKNDKDFDVKNEAVLSLGILGEESVINDLKMMMNDKQATKAGVISRAYAALALGYINAKGTADALKEVISDCSINKEIQCAALLSLSNLEDKSLVPFVAGILNDVRRDESVRAYAALALGRIKDVSVLPELKKALTDRKSSVRTSVAIAMGLIKSPDSKEDLMMLLKDKAPDVRSYAIISLAQLGDKSITPVLLETMKRQDYFTAGICVIALGILGDEKALPILRGIVEKKTNLSIYNAVIVALGLLKDKDAVPLLIKIVKEQDSEPIAWSYAIQSLGMIGDERAVPVLEDAFKKVQKRYDLGINAYNTLTITLAMVGKRKEVLASLYEQLNDKTLLPDIKWRVLHGIGYIGDKSSIEPLVKIYNEEKNDEWVRMYAVFALGFVLDKEKINPLYKIIADNNFNIWLRIIDHIAISKPD